MSTVIEAKDLRKTFRAGLSRRKTEVLRGMNFEVKSGEVFGFLGPNGSGKTTTMKVMMGLIMPTAGSVAVLGKPAGDVEAQRKIGYLPENPYFYDHLSGVEFLEMVGAICGLERATRRKRANELLDRVGLGHAKNRPTRSYSKGMLQRVGLGQALMGDPDLLVLDEPLSGLDPVGRKQVRDIVVDLRDSGKTVFFSTHILADAEALCDRVGIVDKGTVREVGLLEELLGDHVDTIDMLWRRSGPREAHADLLVELGKAGGAHEAVADGWLSIAPDQATADAIISILSTHGASIVSLTPHRRTLEELFLQDGAPPEPVGARGEDADV